MASANNSQPRMISRDRSRPTIARRGIRRSPLGDLYHFLMVSSWPALLGLTVAFYFGANVIFALCYLAAGDCIDGARPGHFMDAFSFSVQTMATIGYGKMVPRTPFANLLVTVEALTGLLWLAMATGLIFAKFSRPTAKVMFSKLAVVTARDGRPTLMFRLANTRGNQIVDAQVRLVLARTERTLEGEEFRRFHDLHLVRDRSLTFALTWTVMHIVDEKSALFGESTESLAARSAELLVSLLGIDETISQTVHARFSYLPHEIHWGSRLADVIVREKGKLLVDYTRFHEVEATSATAQAAK
jgi:inward rectifier potassium channel